MSSTNPTNPNELNLQYVLAIVLFVITGAVVLHLLFPGSLLLRALACGTVTFLAVVFGCFISVRIAYGDGSIITGLEFILGIVAATTSLKSGWTPTLWISACYLAFSIVFGVIEKLRVYLRRRDDQH